MMNKYSLTFPQKNIWLVEQFFGKSAINTIVGKFKVNKGFDYDICSKAINKMLEVNEGLRLQVGKNEDEVYQYIQEYTEYNVDFYDMSGKTKEELEKLEEDLKVIPFDVIDKPLYYIAVVKTGKDSGYIFTKLHHLISDAWTFGNVGTSFAEYIDLYSGKEINDKTVPSYVEYIESEKEYIASEKFIKDKEFWSEYLSGITESVGLKESTIESGIDGKRYTVTLEERFNQLIKEYCKENRLSPYILFMTALAIYLHRVTEKDDFVIGTPVLGRSNFKEKQMMGMFVGTMPVRFKIDEEKTFLDMCKENAKESMSLFRHQKYPYSLILENFRKENDVKSNLYEVMISYQNARAEYSDNEKYSSDWLFSEKVQDQFAIHITDMDETGILEVHFDYLTSLFEDVEIEYIAKRLFTIIEDGIKNNKTIGTIEIMPEEEKNKILYEFNNTKTDYPKDKTVIDLFEEQVRKTPDNIALVFEGKEMTYSELNEKANALAWYLKEEKNIRENEFVGITLNKSIELMIAILGVLKLGACYVPIDTGYDSERKEYMLKDSNCKLNIIENEKDILSFIDNVNVLKLNISDKKNNIQRNESYNYNSLVYTMYTSGTTGKPKGAMITNRNIVRLVKNTNYITFNENDRIIQTGATVFDACTFEYWGALLNGLSLCLISKMEMLDPFLLEKFIDENSITIMWLTAPLFNHIVESNIDVFKNIRVVLTGGDVLSVKHINMVREKFNNIIIVNGYGPTENTTFSNCFVIDKEYKNRIPIGKPIANSTSYVVDSKNRLLPIMVKGELIAGGDGVSKGYVNNEKLTNEKYVEGLFGEERIYKTGDIVRWLDNGVVDFFGRKDNQIKIRGFRIELDEIKNRIQEYGNIKEAYIDVRVHDANQKELYAYFVSDCKEAVSEVLKYLKSKLPSYMLPKVIMQLDKLPLTVNGKIDRKKLLEFDTEIKVVESEEFTEKEKELANYIKEQTGVVLTSATDNFVEQGMDSLLIIKLAIKLSEKYDVDLTTADVFNNSNIRDLLQNISSKGSASKTDIEVNDKERIELTTAQKGIFSFYMANPNSVKYNIPFEVIMTNVDVIKIEQSIHNVINKNDILFTNIVNDSKEIYGKICVKEYEIEKKRCSYEEYLKNKETFVKPMNLEKDLLFRVEIYEVEDKVFVLFDFHHIIFDGYSLNIFLQEVFADYDEENYTVKKFSSIKKEISVEEYEKSKEKTLKKFENLSIETSIRKDDYIVSEKGSNYILNVEEELYKQIKEFCQNEKITVNNFLNSAFILMLAKATNNSDIVIGMSTLGRDNIIELNQIGMFVKTLPIRYKVDNMSITKFIKKCNDELLESMNNIAYSYLDLIKDLKIKRRVGINPLFDIVYTYQYKDNKTLNVSGNSVEINQIYTDTSKFELTFQVYDDGTSPNIVMEYNVGMVDSEKVEQLAMEYINILSKMLQSTTIYVKDVIDINFNKSNVIFEEQEVAFNNSITEQEQKIIDVFSKVLDKKVGVNEDFFFSGGDSLLAIRLASELKSAGYSVTYADIFEMSTPRKMADKIFNNKEVERIDKDIDDYDYKNIDTLLKLQSDSNIKRKTIGNILLTGATGFLGAHILDTFLKEQDGIAYCLVRSVNGVAPEHRLKEKMKFFFNDKYDNAFGKRIKVIEGDVTLDGLFVNTKEVNQIMQNVDLVINSAAHVKHYGDKTLFNKINVDGVNRLIELCLKYNKELVHISTLSVSGNLIEAGQLEQTIKIGTHFNEKNLYIGQNLNNIYAYTKFLAERNILENIQKNGLKAKIVRMGNLTGRTEDGRFQPNVQDNAFANRIKSILQIGKIPENLRNLYLEFTPIDLAAQNVINICKDDEKMIIYHVFNHKHLELENAYKLFVNMGYDLEWVTKEEMHIILEELLKDDTQKDKINGIIQDLNKDSDLEYTSNAIIDSEITCKELNKYGFKWKTITSDYFYNYINYLIRIGFLEGKIYDK